MEGFRKSAVDFTTSTGIEEDLSEATRTFLYELEQEELLRQEEKHKYGLGRLIKVALVYVNGRYIPANQAVNMTNKEETINQPSEETPQPQCRW